MEFTPLFIGHLANISSSGSKHQVEHYHPNSPPNRLLPNGFRTRRAPSECGSLLPLLSSELRVPSSQLAGNSKLKTGNGEKRQQAAALRRLRLPKNYAAIPEPSLFTSNVSLEKISDVRQAFRYT